MGGFGSKTQSYRNLQFATSFTPSGGLRGGTVVKNPSADAGMVGSILGWEDPLEKGMTTHSSILAWEFPWTEEPGGLQSMGLLRLSD